MARAPEKVSDQLERWLAGETPRTLGSLVELFGQGSFALLFVLLLGVSALPLPTGGATHVFEIVAMLLAVQLVAGARGIWLPQRWRRLELAGGRRRRLIDGLLKLITRLEGVSRPRGRPLFNHRLTSAVFGLLVFGLSLAAFVAPPFTGLDTLPSLGVVLLSLGVLLEDVLVVAGGLVAGLVGVGLEVLLGGAALTGIEKLL